ncbi:helix-turn-helix domain-containing protein [Pseudaeromonas sp. ZJS20]|uniref:TetR/AcrR family transcriptional regulator n=1 Tax=Pseudaeromonas aegiceratis TaxID=3153928 RepID=UPI00390CB3DF
MRAIVLIQVFFLHMTTDSRQQARRRQILDAARLCFRQQGFHGTGMAQIALTSRLSVGQIYRSFPSKDAIIEALVLDLTAQKITVIGREDQALTRIARELAWRTLPELMDEEDTDRALFFEIAAEATRNPVVARLLEAMDHRLFTEACRWTRHHYPQLSEEEVSARVELMAVLTEGTLFRHQTAPKYDAARLNALYLQLLQQLFPES